MGSKQLHVYVPEDQYDRWEDRADELNMGLSAFVKGMTEAGQKKFDRSVEPDEPAADLREQRNDLRDELDRARERIEELENALYKGEPATIERFVEDHPGATSDDIIQRVGDTVPSRVTRHLETMEGDVLMKGDDGGYYPKTNSDGGRS